VRAVLRDAAQIHQVLLHQQRENLRNELVDRDDLLAAKVR
jgi:hypothetical protein